MKSKRLRCGWDISLNLRILGIDFSQAIAIYLTFGSGLAIMMLIEQQDFVY